VVNEQIAHCADVMASAGMANVESPVSTEPSDLITSSDVKVVSLAEFLNDAKHNKYGTMFVANAV